MKIALVHEFLNQLGGAEKVLENFLEIWPDATVHVLLYNPEKTQGRFEKYKKKISWLNSLPLVKKHPRLFLPLMPSAIESFKFADFDVVLSDSSSFAHGAKTAGKLHICYCHTPARFLWTDPEYLDQQKYPWILKLLGKIIMSWLRNWDRQTATRPNFFIANSANVANRIKKYFNRDASVIWPPVETEFFHPVSDKKDYFVTVSRLEPYKKVDLLIEAFNDLGLKLKVVGAGTDSSRLKVMAGPNIEFLGQISPEDLRRHYSEAKAFVFAAEEDAGIVLLEAQACGTAVIAFGKGGALEAVKSGITGEFFGGQTAESIKNAVKIFDPSKYDPAVIRQHALQFDKKIFQKKIKEFVESKYENRT